MSYGVSFTFIFFSSSRQFCFWLLHHRVKFDMKFDLEMGFDPRLIRSLPLCRGTICLLGCLCIPHQSEACYTTAKESPKPGNENYSSISLAVENIQGAFIPRYTYVSAISDESQNPADQKFWSEFSLKKLRMSDQNFDPKFEHSLILFSVGVTPVYISEDWTKFKLSRGGINVTSFG